METSEGTVIKC